MARKIEFARHENQVSIVIRAPQQPLLLMVLPILALFSAFGVIMTVREIFVTAHPSPLVFTISFMLLGGVGLLSGITWLWMLAGKEQILLRRGELSLRTGMLGLGRTRRYSLSQLGDLKVGRIPVALRLYGAGSPLSGLGKAMIAFKYGSETVQFAVGIAESEAHVIVRELRARFSVS